MEWSAWQYRGIPEIQLSWHFLQQRRVDGGIAEFRVGLPGVDSKRRVSALKVGTILPRAFLLKPAAKQSAWKSYRTGAIHVWPEEKRTAKEGCRSVKN
jgi:hypothetical protein